MGQHFGHTRLGPGHPYYETKIWMRSEDHDEEGHQGPSEVPRYEAPETHTVQISVVTDFW